MLGRLLPPGRARIVLLALLIALLAAFVFVTAKAWRDTLADPVVRRTSVTLPDMVPGADPVTIALISDIHIAGPDMPPERLERIVTQINALKPDAVLIAGDLISEKKLGTKIYSAEAAVAPLAALDARLGTFLVPGNHDHWFGWPDLRRALAKTSVTILENDAAQVGPLVIGGLNDEYTGHDDIAKTRTAMAKLEGAQVFLGHSPDSLPELPEGSVVLAGHTHCGQIRLPLVGAIATQSRYGKRFACGRIDDPHGTAIVGAGLGTSVLPIRFGTRPEIWLIELRGGGSGR
ncbi:metallophosphoesterase [Citromicrobium bathyomarinum]|uniref:metallophosphoesterase n=1 Tax=Citromicrobium bathyomarinum TaxID=72174 RepID=UPI002685896D